MWSYRTNFPCGGCASAWSAPQRFYACRLTSDSTRAKEDKRLLVPIKESWLDSGSVYGSRKVSNDLRKLGEQRGINRVHRLMRLAGIRSQTGYARRKYKRNGAPALVAPKHLLRQFDAQEPNRVWATDITYLRTH
jgi:putative transposase